MATPDCWASFRIGVSELAEGAGSVAGGVVRDVATGATGGLFAGLFGPAGPEGECAPDAFWCNYGMWVLIAAGAVLFAAVAMPHARRVR